MGTWLLIVTLCTSHAPLQCQRVEMEHYYSRSDCWAAGDKASHLVAPGGYRFRDYFCKPS